MEIGSGKRSSSAGSEKVEKDGDRQKKMEGHCSTGQRSQRAVVPVEEEDIFYNLLVFNILFSTSAFYVFRPILCRFGFILLSLC
jgi:hypothetical protein